MTYTFKHLNRLSKPILLLRIQTHSLLLALPLLALMLLTSEIANATALIVDISAKENRDASVKLESFGSPMPLEIGTWLPRGAVPVLTNGAKISVFCLISSTVLQLDEKSEYTCDSKRQRKMRSADVVDFPIILVPNQQKLNKISRLVWTGSKQGEFQLQVHKYVNTQRIIEDLEKDLVNLKGTYNNESGTFEYELKTPLTLSLKNVDYYEIIILSIQDSRSSNENPDLSSQISSAEPSKLLDQLAKALTDQSLKPESDLGLLAMAAQLVMKGYRAQAYELALKVQAPNLDALKQLIKTQALRIPDVPPRVMVAEYGKALKLAIIKNDMVNAAVACQGIADYKSILPKEHSFIFEEVQSTARFSEYCPLFN